MDRKLATIIGVTARACRLQLGLTQAELAEKLGMTSECYGRMERGHMMPSVETLTRMARVLGASADQLLGLVRPEEKLQASENVETFRESPQMRRLMHHVRKLNARQIRTVTQLLRSLVGDPRDKLRSRSKKAV